VSNTSNPIHAWGEIKLEEAVRDDLPRLLEIEHASQPSPWSEAVFEKELNLEHSHLWVLGSDEIMGFLVFWLVADEMHILNVAVAPSYRRRGLARLMVGQAVECAQSNDCVAITLEVRVGNEAAISLYESFDFRVIGHRPRYYRDNDEDAAIMVRILEESAPEDG